MTRSQHMQPDEWDRLAALWDSAAELSPAERDEFFRANAVDGALREEFESLLARANAAESFFGRLQHVVADATPSVASESQSETPSQSSHTAGPDPMIGATAGHYRIDGRIGHGGMGVVYRATDMRLQRTVALKLLRSHTIDDPRARARLLAEARAAAALDNANICTIYEVGETVDELPFIAMAFYDGETLEQLLKRGPLPVATALDYATQIAWGLGAAHQRGIIHRDVKPANVIVTTDGVLKLLDFGIARHLDIEASHDGVTPGTIAYMPPEQVTSKDVDTRSDLWSLGIVLYEMVTGVRPFRGEHAGAILYAIVHESPIPAQALRPDLPAHASYIIERLLTKDPAQRYDDAESLIADLTSGGLTGTHVAMRAPQSTTPWTKKALWFAVTAVMVIAAVVYWSGRDTVAPSVARLAAEDLYNQGHRDVLFRTESGRREALEFFRQAIAADSTFTTAHAGLAHLLVLISDNSGTTRREQLAEAETAARTAIRLDSLHADAHASLGHVLLFEYQFPEAEIEFKRAVALDAKTPYVREFLVWLYIFMDRPRDALDAAERGVADNPSSPTAIAEQARSLLVNGRCDDALPLLNRLMMLKPPPARVGAIAAQCYAQRGQWTEAIAAVRPVAEQSPLQGSPWLSYMLSQSGDSASGRAVRDTLMAQWRLGNGGAYGVALAYAGERNFDAAFSWLEKSIDDRSLRYNIMEPAFAELRRDARFAGIRQKLGIAN